MSTSGADSTLKGKFNEAIGSVKQGVGEAVGNDKLANDGASDQVKGHAQEAWGAVKNAFSSRTDDAKADANANAAASHERHEGDAHDIREKITSTAQNVKDSIVNAADRFKHHE